MILIIGGAYQGKEAYVRNQLLKENAGMCGATEYEIVSAYHLKIKEQMKAGEEPLEAAKALLEAVEGRHGSGRTLSETAQRQPDGAEGQTAGGRTLVVICDEVGCGVVPMDAFERAWREKVGRVCCYFAKEAAQVIRVVCGVGKRIK